MILSRLKNKIIGSLNTSNDSDAVNDSNSAYILILEDDPDQMSILTTFTLDELQKFIDYENTSEEQKVKITNVKIITVSNIEVLKKAVEKHHNIFLALLDGKTPDEKGSEPHDQFIKKNHQITGKHRAIEIVKAKLPNTPITMVSSLNRFKNLVLKHYKTEHKLDINFINKDDGEMIKDNIHYHLEQYLTKG